MATGHFVGYVKRVRSRNELLLLIERALENAMALAVTVTTTAAGITLAVSSTVTTTAVDIMLVVSWRSDITGLLVLDVEEAEKPSPLGR